MKTNIIIPSGKLKELVKCYTKSKKEQLTI